MPRGGSIPIATSSRSTRRLDADNADALLRERRTSSSTAAIISRRGWPSPMPPRACASRSVSAAVGPFEGQIGVWRGWEEGQPCYRCLVGDARTDPARTCAEEGIVGALAGIIGSMAALEVIRALVPFGKSMTGKLIMFDLLARRFRELAIPKDPACQASFAEA